MPARALTATVLILLATPLLAANCAGAKGEVEAAIEAGSHSKPQAIKDIEIQGNQATAREIDSSGNEYAVDLTKEGGKWIVEHCFGNEGADQSCPLGGQSR